MIDYEKLKKEIEIMKSEFDDMRWRMNEVCNALSLREDRPKPKYKLGDICFVKYNDFDSTTKISGVEITSSPQDDYYDAKWVDTGNHVNIKEEHLFPTRQALIEHQIEHWVEQLNAECIQDKDGEIRPLPKGNNHCTMQREHNFVRGTCFDCGYIKPVWSEDTIFIADGPSFKNECQHECTHDIYHGQSGVCDKCGITFKKECQHVSVCGELAPPSETLNPRSKCIKCGEFYK